MRENTDNPYLGVDGQRYIMGPEIFNRNLLIKYGTGERILARNVKIDGPYITWDDAKTYPRLPRYFLYKSMVLLDYELDVISITGKPVEISKNTYVNLKENVDLSELSVRD